jgi:glycosyltransferase involved in cell wall biosynthesis
VRVTQLLWDTPRRRAMGAAGRQKMRDEFTFESQADAYIDLFDRLAAHTRHPRRELSHAA